jgi:hypothetical protein
MIFQYILIYLFIGLIWNVFYDLLVGFYNLEEKRFTWTERVAVGLIWPVAVVSFIFHFIKMFFGNDEG